jgi:hypothetical protein
MANKKITLTFLWADESVMLEDFSKKISAGMVDWGNEFYGRYGFEFDIDPPPLLRKSFATTRKYALKKSDGVVPDLRSVDEIWQDFDAQIQKLEDEMHAKEAALRAVGMTPAWDAAFEAYKKAIADWSAVSDQRSLKLALADGENDLRAQMASKYVSDGIGSKPRVSVVFCKWNGGLRMRASSTQGRTYMQSGSPILAVPLMLLIWPFPFIIVDIATAPRRTIAHEIVHAAGHRHPDDKIVYTKIQKKLVIPGVSSIPLPIPFRVMSGGYFDGPINDIMNYELDDPDPGDCILQDSDLKLLTAYFSPP